MKLEGYRIWLSAAIPDDGSAEEADRERIGQFVRILTKAVFREGGSLVHCCHPSIVLALLEVAKEYPPGEKAPLVLIASDYFTEDDGGYAGHSVEALKEHCEFELTPISGDQAESLKAMRNYAASRADVLVALGGRWWDTAKPLAGVVDEFELAKTCGIPSFILGGLGGAAGGYLKEKPEILKELRNGFDDATNQNLATLADPDELVEAIVAQIGRLPLGRRETQEGQPFRILALDGGGIKGAFTAAALAHWEEQTGGLPTASRFDLIAGTSTGGILALGLALGLPAKQILDFYRGEAGQRIFPMTSLIERMWRRVRQTASDKFDAGILEEELEKALGSESRLGDAKTRVVVTSYSLTSNSTKLFRTGHHPSVPAHDSLRAVTVARATSAAPTFFKPAQVEESIAEYEAVDGGVWANCPAMVALCEAVHVLKIPLGRIDMLSIGTTSSPSLVEDPEIVKGQLGWATRAPNLLVKGQVQGTLEYATQLLADDRFLRVDGTVETEGMDEVENLPKLVDTGVEIAKQGDDCICSRYFNQTEIIPWRPING